ncbi:MAG: cache domain-containing protein, partial [Candidatus Pelethousia sp.]|nr:cache domain-containing protein [Candidatus Pelethousia sp.]
MKKLKAENVGVKANFGLKQKILLPAIGLLVLTVCVILGLVLALSSRNTTELSSDLMFETAGKYAGQIQGKLTSALEAAKALNPVFSQVGRNTSRTADINLLKALLEQNGDLFGTFTIWEPNAYDGIDSLNINAKHSDATGRFIPYVHRNGDEVIVEPMADYETEGVGDFYLVPKNTLKETVVDPFYYEVNSGQVLVSSMVVPLIRNDKFVGVVGMDIQIDTLVEELKGAVLFDTGYLFMADSNGHVFYHPDASYMGQSLFDMWGGEGAALLTEAYATGKTVEFDEIAAGQSYEKR